MAKIRRRSSKDGGGYQVRYYGPDGRRRAQTFPRRREADQFAATVEADKARGQWVDPAQTRTRFGDYVAGYLDTLSHLRPSSRLKVEGHLRNYILPTFGEVRVGEIRPNDVRAWVAAMLDTGLSPATVKAVVGTFSRILNQTVTDGLIPRSPVLGLQLPKEGRGEEMRVLEPRQVAALASIIEPRFRTLIFTAPTQDFAGASWPR